MGLWSSINYADPTYDLASAGNLNNFFSAAEERFDAIKTDAISFDQQIDFSGIDRVSIWPTIVDAEIQGAAFNPGPLNSSFGTIMNELWIDHNSYLDPTFPDGFGGPDPNALSYIGPGPTYLPVARALFEHVLGFLSLSDEWRSAASVPALTSSSDIYRRTRPREIGNVTASEDADGNAAVVGMRAFFISNLPLLDTGQQMLYASANNWIPDNGGPVDQLDSTQVGGSRLLGNPYSGGGGIGLSPFITGDYIYSATFFSELRSLINILVWIEMPHIIDVGGATSSGFGGTSSPSNWTIAVGLADSDFDNNEAPNPFAGGFGMDTIGFYESDSGGVDSCTVESNSMLCRWSELSPKTFDLEFWFIATKEAAASLSGGYDVTLFDNNGFNLADDEWSKVDEITFASGSGTRIIGNTAVGKYPVSTLDPASVAFVHPGQTDATGFTWQGFEQKLYQNAATGGFLDSLRLVAKFDVSGGFVWVTSFP